MAKISNRDKILSEGLRVVHERGFAGASVRDIANAAQVPLGSFTNHFASKEAFGLEILDRYYENAKALMARTLENEALSPLKRIEAYFDETDEMLKGGDLRNGCLFGNFSAEVVGQCEAMRVRLIEIFEEIRETIVRTLIAAVQAGELRADYDCEETGGFIFASLQGAILIAKTLRSEVPMQRYKKHIFRKVLR